MMSIVDELLARSWRLGADPRNTNYAGGNTSAKGTATDPATGRPVELLWVKGSGGDLGTLNADALAVLRLDRLRSLVDVYPGVDREDEMVAAFDYCLHGRGGAAPSIDTAMHGLVDAAHVDHLHPDTGIALATAADGEALTKECYGDRVVWVPWRRPGFQLGLDIAAVRRAQPQAIGVILGGHGITAWGATSDECQAHSLEIIQTAQAFIDRRGRADPFRPTNGVNGPPPSRLSSGASRAPTGRRWATSPTPTRSWTSWPAPNTRAWPRSAPRARIISCVPRCARSCWTCHRPRRWTRRSPDCGICMPPTAPSTAPTTSGTPALTRRRCAVPTQRSSWCRASACSASAATSRPRAWRGSSTSTPSTSCAAPRLSPAMPRSRKRRSSGSSTGHWRRPNSSGCRPPSRSPAGSASSPVPAPGSAGRSPAGSQPRVPASWSPTATRRRPGPWRATSVVPTLPYR